MLPRAAVCILTAPQTLGSGLLILTGQDKQHGFNAYTSKTIFRLGISSDVEYALLPALFNCLRIEAPDVTLTIVPADPQQLPSLLSSGDISLGIGPAESEPAILNQRVLRTLGATVLRADTGPGPLSLEDFCRRPHASVSFARHIDRYIDECLGIHGRQRRVVMAVSQFNSLPALLIHTDLLALVPDYVATEMVKKGGLRAEPAPLPDPGFNLSMTWSHAASLDPAQQWLRSRCILLLGAQPD
jgi:LysR family transcriptional activator of mexEF-oprN operon